MDPVLKKLRSAFLAQMMATSSPPNDVDENSLLDLYAQDLGEFDPLVLKKAYNAARQERPSNYWVRPEEIRKHAFKFKPDRVPELSEDHKKLIGRRDRALKAHDMAIEWMNRYENKWVYQADMTGIKRWLAENILGQIRNNEEPVAFVPDEIRERFKTFPVYQPKEKTA